MSEFAAGYDRTREEIITLFARLFAPRYVRNKLTLPFFLMTSEPPSHFYLTPYNVALHCLVAPKVRSYDQKYQLGVGGGGSGVFLYYSD